MPVTHNYEDILYQKRPVSSHPHMDQKNRAKIFVPFAALRGYQEAITAAMLSHHPDDLQVIDEEAFLKELYDLYQD